METRVREDGTKYRVLGIPPAELAARYGCLAPDGVTLLVMGRVDHAGAG